MTPKEAISQQMQTLKGMSWKARLEHIITYYWFSFVVILCVLIFIISYTVHLVTLKEPVLNVICLNSSAVDSEADRFGEAFAQATGIDTEQYAVKISTNMAFSEEKTQGGATITEVLLTRIVAQSVDVLVSDEETMYQHFYQGILADLSQLLTPTQQEQYASYFLYVDQDVLEEVKHMTDLENIPDFPDPSKPETMKNPVPVAIRMSGDSRFLEVFFPDCGGAVSVGIAINSPNVSNALAFLDYIME